MVVIDCLSEAALSLKYVCSDKRRRSRNQRRPTYFLNAPAAAFSESDWPKWLSEEPATAKELLALLKLCPDDALKIRKIDRRVGNVRSTGPRVSPACVIPCSRPQTTAVTRSSHEGGCVLKIVTIACSRFLSQLIGVRRPQEQSVSGETKCF